MDIEKSNTTSNLARSIAWDGSKQTSLIALLMVDRDLVADFLSAYAYFRWADDIIDAPVSQGSTSRSNAACLRFVDRQRQLIDRFYRHEQSNDLAPEEKILADLISRERGEDSGLQSFVRNMFAVIEFDAFRRGRLISQNDLTWYTEVLSKAVTDGLQYFVGNGHPYPDTGSRYLAAKAAHIAHMLRDMRRDISDGFINIPQEYLITFDIDPTDVESAPFRAWVRRQVELSRQYFRQGKRYLDGLKVLRCKLAGYWYCARFERVLDVIEREGYVLREEYNIRREISTWFSIAWLSVVISFKHLVHTIYISTEIVKNVIIGKDNEDQAQNIRSRSV